MTNKIKITVGIAAYNEENNIVNLLNKVLLQKQHGFLLERIIVYSDGSTDKTFEEAESVKSRLIKIIKGKSRKGKVVRVNEITGMISSDALIILDADIDLKDDKVFEKIVKKLLEGNDLVSCRILPLPTETFIQKVLEKSLLFQDRYISKFKNGNSVFTCHGPIRILSKKLYKKIVFPKLVGEDAYSYFYCIANGLKYGFVKNAAAYINLPTNISDHLRQSTRFNHSKVRMAEVFGKDFINKSYSLPIGKIYRYILIEFIKSPLYFGSYVVINYYANLLSLLKEPSTIIWDVSESSKIIK